ncbi:MAG: biotin--[acetyl-CoA-carboxylase] ligase [Alphaproteobacteria bacterium]|nr:biotin--[acetyl-CoA-carboxylase] ligase [Alphaproteobacteria bacterium]
MAFPALDRAWPVVHFEEIDSTNEEAQRRARLGDRGPVWIQADFQTAGRGRMGRSWASPSGNLCATAFFTSSDPPARTALLSFAAALALHEAVGGLRADNRDLRLKWPNDLMWADAKIAGILIETGAISGGLWVAAGFGVNIATAPNVPGRRTGRLADLPGGGGIRPLDLLDALEVSFRGWLSTFRDHGFEPVREAWKERAAGLGQRIGLSPAHGSLEGIFRDLGPDGALILELDGGDLRHIRAGEISVLG